MIDLIKESEIAELAGFLDINLNNLNIRSDYEQKLIANAHRFSGETRFQVMNFLSQVIRPKAVSPELIFKCLKWNETFFTQQIGLIRATEWMRQEVYEKSKKSNILVPDSSVFTGTDENMDSACGEKSGEKIDEIKQSNGSTVIIFAFVPQQKDIEEKYLLRRGAGPANGRYKLPACYHNGEELDYTASWTEVSPSNGKTVVNGYVNVEIFLTPKDPTKFFTDKRNFYLKTFSNAGRSYSIGPIQYSVKDNNDKVRFYVENVPAQYLFDHAWAISYTEEIR